MLGMHLLVPRVGRSVPGRAEPRRVSRGIAAEQPRPKRPGPAQRVIGAFGLDTS
jgi:hypothetical protein